MWGRHKADTCHGIMHSRVLSYTYFRVFQSFRVLLGVVFCDVCVVFVSFSPKVLYAHVHVRSVPKQSVDGCGSLLIRIRECAMRIMRIHVGIKESLS